MKVLVTGASGGMGPSVIESLLRRNIDVITTSRSGERLKSFNFYSKIRHIPYDLGDRTTKDLFALFDNPDSVIHLAWDKLKEHKSELHTTTILDDHKSFIGNLVSNGLNDINIIGTVYEYGLKEGELKETDPSSPVISYAIAKNLLRQYTETLQREYTFSMKWIRVFNVFSPGKEGGNLYSHIINAINAKQEYFNMSGGEQVRDYMSGEEVAETIVRISLQKNVLGIINCASGKPVKLKTFVQQFLDEKKSPMKLNLGFYPYLAHEPMEHWGSTEKLKSALKNSP